MVLKRIAAIPKPTAVLLLAAAMLASWGLASQWLTGADRLTTSPSTAAEANDYQVTFWAERAEENDLDYLSRTNLAVAHLAAGRQTGDFDAYDTAEAPIREALALNPRYSPALTTLAAVHLGRHEFPAALIAAEQALEHDPASVEALAALGDAHLELGHYDQAATAFEALERRLPGPASQARLAHLAFLEGQPDEAIDRAREALELDGTNPDPSYRAALTTYALDAGDIDLAATTAQRAFTQTPEAPAAIETLAQVRVSQGRLDEAAVLYERLLEEGPDPAAHAALGDIYTALGQPDAAQQQYLAVEPAAASITDSPVVFDREIAIFFADHQIDVDRAVDIAERDLENRQDIYGYDTVAWARYQAGDLDGATQAMNKALALGTKDPHLFYHAGMIAAATGNHDQARHYLSEALTINPRFDLLQAPNAAEALRALN